MNAARLNTSQRSLVNIVLTDYAGDESERRVHHKKQARSKLYLGIVCLRAHLQCTSRQCPLIAGWAIPVIYV